MTKVTILTMNKQELIKEILYRAADQLAELLVEEPEPALRPLYASKTNLAAMFGLSRQTVAKIINEASEAEAIGTITEGKSTKYSIYQFEHYAKERKRNERQRRTLESDRADL